jgi:Gpi18-like mannosyltransferase
MSFFHFFYVCHSPLNKILNLILKEVIKILLSNLRRVVSADTVYLIYRPDLYVIMV